MTEATTTEPVPDQDASRERTVRHLRMLAKAMDNQFTVPVINARIGWDGILGLLPVGGDLAGLAVSVYIILSARKLGVSKWKLWRMGGRVAFDTLLGAVPVVGDVFDIAYKANVRNLKSIGIDARAESDNTH